MSRRISPSAAEVGSPSGRGAGAPGRRGPAGKDAPALRGPVEKSGRKAAGGKAAADKATPGRRAPAQKAAGRKAAGRKAEVAKATPGRRRPAEKAAGQKAAVRKATPGRRGPAQKAAGQRATPGRRGSSKDGTPARSGGTEAVAAVSQPGTAGPLPASLATGRAMRSQGRRTMRKLLDAAMEVFDQRGYHATRINDVVEVAETSHGTFYLYFSNKEDLLRALVAEAAEEGLALRNNPATTAALGSARDDLRAWIGQYSRFWLHHAPLMRVWTELIAIDPGLGRLVRRTLASMEEALAARIAASASANGVDPKAASLAVLAMLDRFHYLREFLGEPVDDAALETLTDIVHRALFAPAGGS